MPPARPFWKGYLKLSLVSCPIALFPASSSSERVSFRQINKKTGHRLDSPYYLTPENKVGQDAFAVIREAMRRKGMVGLGKVVISRRERIVMLEPFKQGLMATTLRYGYEVRDAKPYFEDLPEMKLPDEMVKLAEHILDTKTGHFDPAEFEDRYENAVVEMLKQKQAGMPVRKEAPVTAPSTVINLMDALRRSIQKEQSATKKGKAPEKVGRQSGKRKTG